jgi:hypothetical protein
MVTLSDYGISTSITMCNLLKIKKLAERVGFEPTIPVKVCPEKSYQPSAASQNRDFSLRSECKRFSKAKESLDQNG